MPFPRAVRIQALIACQRFCCLCQKRKHTRIACHHIDQNAHGGADTFENCIPLCPDCHAEVKAFDPQHHPGMTSYSKDELLKRRDDWYEVILRRTKDLECNLTTSRANYPRSDSLEGVIEFDYSNDDGRYLIGHGKNEFLTNWSGAGRTSIHSYTDGTNISVALAAPRITLAELSNAESLDFSSRVRTPKLGEILILENHHCRYAAIKVIELKSRSHRDDFDFAKMRYWILDDGSSDFTVRA